MPSLPIPEPHGSVVPAAEQHIILVDSQRVDDAVMPVEILHQSALGTLPLLDCAGRGGCEGEFLGVQGEGPHALFVVCEHAGGLAGGEIVHADGTVETRADDLRIAFLSLDAGDGARVA